MQGLLYKEYNNLVKHKDISYNENQIILLKILEKLRLFLEKNDKRFLKKNYDWHGIYIYGDVGRGKSLLMDLFFKHCNISKKRLHFHEYMVGIHRELHQLRKEIPHLTNPLKKIAKDFSKKFKLLCFDEFQVTDVADAMILEQLFKFLCRI